MTFALIKTFLIKSMRTLSSTLSPRSVASASTGKYLCAVHAPIAHQTVSLKTNLTIPTQAFPFNRPLRVRHIVDSAQRHSVGRIVISGRMADVCAELDRLAACEAAM